MPVAAGRAAEHKRAHASAHCSLSCVQDTGHSKDHLHLLGRARSCVQARLRLSSPPCVHDRTLEWDHAQRTGGAASAAVLAMRRVLVCVSRASNAHPQHALGAGRGAYNTSAGSRCRP